MTTGRTDGAPHPTPRLVVVTDRAVAAGAGRDVVEQVTEALAAGAPGVWFRDRHLPPEERRVLGERVAEAVHAAGATLWVSPSAPDPAPDPAPAVDLARHLGAHALHLPADVPVPGPRRGLGVGRSCHDRDAVRAAVAAGLDHVTVSPVAPTATKPGHGPPLGPAGVADLVRAADGVPVVALGGVTPDLVGSLRTAGAHGVAVLGPVMTAARPGEVVTSLLAALDT